MGPARETEGEHEAEAECADEALVGADEQPQEPVEYVYVYGNETIEKRTCTSYIEINSETVEPAGGYKFDNQYTFKAVQSLYGKEDMHDSAQGLC